MSECKEEKYLSNGSINPYWAMEQERIARERNESDNTIHVSINISFNNK